MQAHKCEVMLHINVHTYEEHRSTEFYSENVLLMKRSPGMKDEAFSSELKALSMC